MLAVHRLEAVASLLIVRIKVSVNECLLHWKGFYIEKKKR